MSTCKASIAWINMSYDRVAGIPSNVVPVLNGHFYRLKVSTKLEQDRGNPSVDSSRDSVPQKCSSLNEARSMSPGISTFQAGDDIMSITTVNSATS